MSATLIKLAHHLSAQNPTDPLTLHEEHAAPAPSPQKTPCLTGHLLLVSLNTFSGTSFCVGPMGLVGGRLQRFTLVHVFLCVSVVEEKAWQWETLAVAAGA